jgi:hypothetical protein
MASVRICGWQQDGQGRWVEAGWIAGKEAGESLRRDAGKMGIVIGREGEEANGGPGLVPGDPEALYPPGVRGAASRSRSRSSAACGSEA